MWARMRSAVMPATAAGGGSRLLCAITGRVREMRRSRFFMSAPEKTVILNETHSRGPFDFAHGRLLCHTRAKRCHPEPGRAPAHSPARETRVEGSWFSQSAVRPRSLGCALGRIAPSRLARDDK